jgi:hypothetical protein
MDSPFPPEIRARLSLQRCKRVAVALHVLPDAISCARGSDSPALLRTLSDLRQCRSAAHRTGSRPRNRVRPLENSEAAGHAL